MSGPIVCGVSPDASLQEILEAVFVRVDAVLETFLQRADCLPTECWPSIYVLEQVIDLWPVVVAQADSLIEAAEGLDAPPPDALPHAPARGAKPRTGLAHEERLRTHQSTGG